MLESTPDGSTVLRSEESMAGPLLTLFYSSAKLDAGMRAWLDAIKTAAERR